MAKFSLQDLFGSFGSVASTAVREEIENGIAKTDPSILLNQSGWRKKIADMILNHPKGIAIGIDTATTIVGKIASKHNRLLGRSINDAGEGFAYGLEKLAEEAKKGKKITVEQIDTALKQASVVIEIVKRTKNSQLKKLTVGQRRAFFALLLAAREEQHFDNTPAWVLDPMHAHRAKDKQKGFRGLEGRAFQLEDGLLHLLENDIDMLIDLLPKDKSFNDVYYYPTTHCQEIISAAVTCKSMRLSKLFDVIDLMIDKEDAKAKISKTVSKTLNWARNIAVLIAVLYPFFMYLSVIISAILIVIFLGTHVRILFGPTPGAWTVGVMMISYLGILGFKYTVSILDIVHAGVFWLIQRLNITNSETMGGKLAQIALGFFGKENLLNASHPLNEKKFSSVTSSSSTVLIAATAIALLTIAHYGMGGGTFSGFVIIFVELLLILAIEINRKLYDRIPESNHVNEAIWIRSWTTRAALAGIGVIALFVLFYAGMISVNKFVDWTTEKVSTISSSITNSSPVTTTPVVPSDLSARQKAICEHFAGRPDKLPSYCK